MPDTLTDSLQLIQQDNNENTGTWGDNVDTTFERIEQAIADQTAKTVTGAADVTLTSEEQRKPFLLFTGTLTANQTVIVPAAEKSWWVQNATSGAFTLTVKTSAGTGVPVPQGSWRKVYCDGTNVEAVSQDLTVSFPIDDTTELVRDPTDNTKRMRIDVGNIGTGQTRVLTMPDRNVDLDAIANADLADMAEATIKGRASGAGTGDPVDLTSTQVRAVINVEDGATADQTDAEIKTAYEANADTNAFTDAEQTKLSGIEASADVTDASNVAAAGAVMDSNISETEGFMRKTGAGAYEAIKTNLSATTNPTVSDDSTAGYAIGSRWINTTSDFEYVCLDASVGAAVWTVSSATAVNLRNHISSPVYVATTTALKALDTTSDTLAILTDAGRGGAFAWRTGDFSTLVTADTAEGIYLKADAIATTVGAWVRLDFLEGNPVQVEWFGAAAYTQAELETLDGDAAITTRATANTTAFQAASDLIESVNGGKIMCQGQIYVKDATTEVGEGVIFVGAGLGYWAPRTPGRQKTWEGTSILMKGTGTQDHTFEGVTSMKEAGGWREDPDNGGQYFKLTSFMNADATGTTPATTRSFSVAFKKHDDLDYSANWGIQDMRVTNWSGTNGIEGHSDEASTSLGDAWDIGLLLENSEFCRVSNVQVVGDWREYAFLLITPGFDDYGLAERNFIEHSTFQGRIGMGFRASDRWAVTATTSNSVEIYFTDECYWPESGTFRGSDNVIYTYTGVTHTGTATSFTFTGVTPDPDSAGIFQVRSTRSGTGVANTEIHDCLSFGLDHVSGDVATTFSLSDSASLEISGFPMRGLKFRNFKAQSREDTLVFAHDCQDLTFMDPQFEGGGHIIASPFSTDATYANAPVGETRNIIMLGDVGIPDNDVQLFTPRNGFVQGLQVGEWDDLTGDLNIKPLRTPNVVDIYGSDGNSFFRLEELTWTPAFQFVTAPTYTVQDGRYIRIGDIVYFSIELSWSSLDNTDVSGINISLPVNPDTAKPITGQVLERISTGIDLTGLTRPHLDIAADGTSLGITHNRVTRVSYDTASVMDASGILAINGHYWAA